MVKNRHRMVQLSSFSKVLLIQTDVTVGSPFCRTFQLKPLLSYILCGNIAFRRMPCPHDLLPTVSWWPCMRLLVLQGTTSTTNGTEERLATRLHPQMSYPMSCMTSCPTKRCRCDTGGKVDANMYIAKNFSYDRMRRSEWVRLCYVACSRLDFISDSFLRMARCKWRCQSHCEIFCSRISITKPPDDPAHLNISLAWPAATRTYSTFALVQAASSELLLSLCFACQCLA